MIRCPCPELTAGQDFNDADFGFYRLPEAVKQLYFTDDNPGAGIDQGLDRLSPVDYGDTTTASSGQLIVPQSKYQVRDDFNDGKFYTGNDGTEDRGWPVDRGW